MKLVLKSSVAIYESANLCTLLINISLTKIVLFILVFKGLQLKIRLSQYTI